MYDPSYARSIIKIEIHGKPIPQQRPRLSKSGKAYNKQSKEKRFVQWQIKSEMTNRQISRRAQGPLSVSMIFHMPIPSSWSKKRSKSIIGKPHVIRPDIDNICKFYLDTMNQIIYDDDGQIFELKCKKIYSDNPKVSIEIKEE
tara:strand:- start:445 stop:873 length:429 start_codon:yes stop_codon:yes gene_type:complete